MLNHCTFIGHLGKDPETRDAGGNKVANFSIACTERWKDKNGAQQERTEWVRCVAWGPLAGVIESYLRKGSKVYVAGRMETRKWQDKDGRDQYTTEINVQTMKMLDGKPADSSAPSAAPASSEPATTDEIPF